MARLEAKLVMTLEYATEMKSKKNTERVLSHRGVSSERQ